MKTNKTVHFVFFSILSFMFQSCDSEIELSIPNQIRLSGIVKLNSNQNEDIRINYQIYDEKTHTYQWILKEIPKLRSGWSQYYATVPSLGIMIDFGDDKQLKRLQISEYGILYITSGSVLRRDFQKEKFLELMTCILKDTFR
ncbi:putative lipoprotein [Leptospira weilii str. Ecochallenge]|uniref:Putative lipoprotein n=1 Tax=Leptospira weilii str. Ecochallenge TaxID=1049986 RepID=N1U5G9_9LEPT|nr:putative lipoprotein [Leptospira weilii str. Ecochallenge]